MKVRAVFLKYKIHHLLFWALVFAVWYFLRFQDYRTKEMAAQVTLLKVADLALMIYITNYLLIPKLLYRRWYLLFTGCFIIMVIVSSVSKMYLIGQIINRPDLFSFSGNLKARIYDNVIPHFFLVIAGAAFKLLLDYTRAQRRLADLAREKAEAELNFLKSQINPHFLFNSLNSVYFLIDKNNSPAREALHKFSDMLRYQLYEMNGDKIPIEKEISYLRDYVDLQKLRKDEKYTVQFDCSSDVKGFSIEPLLLIPFVENAFKHISNRHDKMNYIKLNLNRDNGEFIFTVENTKEKNQPAGRHEGIGLNNVKRRLELLYPGRHDLQIMDTDDKYSIDLKLKIDS